MSEFLQQGPIAALHLLQDRAPELLEIELEESAENRSITLVLPCLISEMEGPALAPIVNELKEINYLDEILVTLGPATEEEFAKALRYFQALKKEGRRVRLIWNNGPRIAALFDELTEIGLDAGPDGKGRSAWMAYGFVVSRGVSHVIALHDCDIVTYERNLLNRLVYPTLVSGMDYHFSKGYYSRTTGGMYGRTTRLLVAPLLQSLMSLLGNVPILEYLSSFRYPLAGEFSMTTDLARVNEIPSDWGLEVGSLAEVYRNAPLNRICQVELCHNYDHKHQILSPDDPGKGLNKMAIDICKTIFKVVAASGVIMNDDFFEALCSTFRQRAYELVGLYQDDARMNGLQFDPSAEAQAAETFTSSTRIASEAFLENPLGAPPIPSWKTVFSRIPDMDGKLVEAVELDNSPHFD